MRNNETGMHAGWTRMRCSALSLAIAAGLSAPAAWAQHAAADSDDGDAQKKAVTLDEVVVTAQHRREDLQKVPTAITAVSGEASKLEGKNTLQDAIDNVPSVEFQTSNRGGGFYIRGIGARFYGSSAPVSIFYDGVYQSRSELTNLGFLDVERIEVLRGPQGTLYGRNNSGGTINIIGHDPVLGETSGSIMVQAGNYDQIGTEGVFNVPLNDIAALRVAVGSNSHSGYLTNGLDDEDSQSARVKLLVQPSEAVRLLLAADYAHNGGKGVGDVYLPVSSRSNPWYAPSYSPLYNVGSGEAVCGAEGQEVCNPYQNTKSSSVRGQLDWNVGWGVLTALAAYQDYESSYRQAYGWVYEDSGSLMNQKSAELRLAAPAGAAVPWVVGAYWLKIDASGGWVRNYSFGSYSLTPRDINESAAVFGQVTWPLGERSRLTTGARYTKDKFETGSETSGIINIASGSMSKVTWRAAFEHDFSDKVLGFASVSTGYKQGGIAQSANTGTIFQYDPETVTAYELGLKSKLFDDRLLLNADIYWYQYKGYQLDISYYPDPNSSVYETRTSNVPGTSRVAGLEVEGKWLMTLADSIDFSIAHTDTKFADAQVLLGASSTDYTNLSGRELPNSPKWTERLGYRHVWELPRGSLSAYVGAKHSSSYVADLIYFTYADPSLFVQKSVTKYDASLTWDSLDGAWSVSLYGNNLSNEATIIQANPTGPGDVLGTLSPPRTYGITFKARY